MTLANETNGYESKFIEKIVNVVKDKVNCNILSITPHLVGIDASAHSINLWIRNGSTDVEVFALYGIGGVGKTTMAKYVYNMNLHFFEGGSFLENVREFSERFDGLVCLQRQLLSDISKGKTPTINNHNDGIRKLQNAVNRRKLLIVLDDVDHVEQSDAIFGMREWFYPGSKIILTTRNVELLGAHEPCTRHAVETLYFNDSLKLFSWHAFRDSHPPEHYKDHSERIIKQCEGLPLALKVIGASLHGKKVDVWRSAIEKLEVIPHFEVQKILRISYDSLQDDYDKDLFLEIACFFNGEAKSWVVGVLNECNYFPTIGIENLINRCLLKIEHGKLRMHPLIQNMGREIICQQSLKEPGLRSRLWYYKDSLEVLTNQTGTGVLEGLALGMNMTNACQAELRTVAFSMMHKLRLLKLNNVRLSGGYKDFPKKLKWLTWHNFHLRSLPSGFPLRSLVAIDMQSSKLQKLVHGNMLLKSLKFLNLSHSHDLVKSLNFAELKALEQLILEDCVSLVQIDESIGMAEGLVVLDLKDCKLLKTLPKNICMLQCLETLIISGCSNLDKLPAEMKNMKSLKVFHADGLDFGNSSYRTQENKRWRDFMWGWVSKPRIGPQLLLTSLPCKSITRLSLENCNLHDNDFPMDLCFGHSVEYLDLSKNPICFLPDCFKGLNRLNYLRMMECNRLQALEDLPNMIGELDALECPVLEKITFDKPDMFLKSFCYPRGCKKLVEMAGRFKIVPIENIDPEFINNCGIYDVEVKKRIQMKLYNTYTSTTTRCSIQGIFQNQQNGKAFSIFYPGGSVPLWFLSQRKASSLSFTVSHSKLRYLNTCIVYNLNSDSRLKIYLIISNRTKDIMIIYVPACYGIPEGDECMTWLSHWKLGSHEVGPGDEVNISIFTYDYNTSFELKDIGINPVYEGQEEEGVHSAKRQKIQQTCGRTSQYVIQAEAKPYAHYGTTRLYYLGSSGPWGVGLDCLMKKTLQ